MVDNELLQAMSEMLDTKLNPIKEDVSSLKEDVSSLKTSVNKLDQRVSSLEMTLETETNRNIKIIAENHVDLSRKLDAALKVENEKELLLIRVNTLENEVRKIKEKIS